MIFLLWQGNCKAATQQDFRIRRVADMNRNDIAASLSLTFALGAPAHAATPVEGALGFNAAAILLLLGIGALLMGMRNLRELRHKRIVPERQRAVEQALEESLHSSDAL